MKRLSNRWVKRAVAAALVADKIPRGRGKEQENLAERRPRRCRDADLGTGGDERRVSAMAISPQFAR
jgi:hypothetical protein